MEVGFVICGRDVDLQLSLFKCNTASAKCLCTFLPLCKHTQKAESSHKPLNSHLTARCPKEYKDFTLYCVIRPHNERTASSNI